ncbi:MAG: terminase small subunit [Candidatus Metalachnospira sp.]|nr:terminase small subunit [Candidatus Metalachnospira sp.]
MTEKQKRFADEYLIDLNATRAYKEAYPAVKKDDTARVNGSRMLTNANVKKYIDEQLKIISDGKVAKAQEVMEYLTAVLRGESESEVVVVEGCGDGCSEARRINKLPDEKERLKAAELLGKRYGLFTENVKLDGPAVVKIIDDIGGTDDAEA